MLLDFLVWLHAFYESTLGLATELALSLGVPEAFIDSPNSFGELMDQVMDYYQLYMQLCIAITPQLCY